MVMIMVSIVFCLIINYFFFFVQLIYLSDIPICTFNHTLIIWKVMWTLQIAEGI